MKARIGAMAAALLLALAPAMAARWVPGPRSYAGAVDFEQHLDRSLPGELRFRDEQGSTVRIGDYLGQGPLGLVFSYYGCTNLCPAQIRNLAQHLAQAPGEAARQAQVLVVSIDPLDSPALAQQAKHKFLDGLLAPERAQRWHFLSGAQDDIARLAESAGFRYGYDEKSHQYAHPDGFALLTPAGRFARYFFGFDFTADELGQAFDQAGAQRIAFAPIQRLLLVCFHFDVADGRYSALILDVLRIAALFMVTVLLGLAAGLLRRGRRIRAGGS